MNGLLTNTGHGALVALDNSTRRALNVSGGPLSYKYQLHELHIRYGLSDVAGSEHLIDGRAFPAEVYTPRLGDSRCRAELGCTASALRTQAAHFLYVTDPNLWLQF